MNAEQLRWAAGWRAAELQVFRVFMIAKRSGKREPSKRTRVSARLKPCPSDCGVLFNLPRIAGFPCLKIETWGTRTAKQVAETSLMELKS
jgi:hypothetical protein